MFSNIIVARLAVDSSSKRASSRAIMRNGPTTMQCFAGSTSGFFDFAASNAAGGSCKSRSVPDAFNGPTAAAGSYTPARARNRDESPDVTATVGLGFAAGALEPRGTAELVLGAGAATAPLGNALSGYFAMK